jgi:hypothetical protein
MKKILVFISILLLGATLGFVSTDYVLQTRPQVFKKHVSIAPNANTVPDTNVFLQIGDATGANVGALLLYSTDTTTVNTASHKKRGVIIFNSVDTSLWINTGKRWKKVGS